MMMTIILPLIRQIICRVVAVVIIAVVVTKLTMLLDSLK